MISFMTEKGEKESEHSFVSDHKTEIIIGVGAVGAIGLLGAIFHQANQQMTAKAGERPAETEATNESL